MPAEFKLPELGENIKSGDVVQVLVSVGDTVDVDQPVLELETDKATIEVPSSVSGRVTDLAVKPGDKIKVGQLILTVDAADGEGREAAPSSRAKEAPASRDKAAGKKAEEGEEAEAEAPAPPAREGEARKEAAEREAEEEAKGEGEEAEGAVAPAPGRRGEVVDFTRAAQPAPAAAATETPTLAAPSVRRLAREIGVEIGEVSGSGPSGRVLAEDVKTHAKQLLTRPSRSAVAPDVVALPDFTRWGQVERSPMRGVRRKTAERLALAWRTVAHVTQHDKADVTALDHLRQQVRHRPEGEAAPLTITAFALKIAAAALKRFPQFNASIDVEREEIIYKRYIHIGVAVDTERGLLVPVVRDADRKGVLQLSTELAALAEKARTKRLTIEEMEGGTFTITNLGGFGGTYFTPIVNAPEVAILGISRASTEPVFINGRFEPRLMLPLSLSYDHRVIDGADAIRFLRWVVERFEQPYLLELDREPGS